MWDNPWFVGIAGSTVATLIISGISAVIYYLRSRSGELSGEWDQVVLNDAQVVIKKDKVLCQHFGTHVKGTIRRIDPIEQAYKTWTFSGEIRNKLFFAIYWTNNPKKNPGSYGTIQMYITHEGLLEGFYVRLSETQDRKKRFSTELSSVPFRWERRK